MTNKHTPGPWEKIGGTLVGRNGKDVVAAGLGLGLGSDGGDGVRTANARLIAAAPELLELLQSFPSFMAGEGAADEWNAKRRAAIAKATGK